MKSEILNVQSVNAETVQTSLLALSLKNRFTIENQWSESTQLCVRTIAALQKALLLDEHKWPVIDSDCVLKGQGEVCKLHLLSL